MALPATSRFEPASLQSSIPLRVIELPPPPKPLRPSQIRGIRQAFNVSQVVFARIINVSPSAVESWEQGVAFPLSRNKAFSQSETRALSGAKRVAEIYQPERLSFARSAKRMSIWD